MTTTHRIMLGVALAAMLAAAPASAAPLSADLEVSVDTLTSVPVTGVDPNPDTISYGQTKVYVLTVTNLGPNQAELTTISALTIPEGLVFGGIAGCTMVGTVSDANPLGLPCQFSNPILVGDQHAVEVDVTVTLPIPTVPAADPANPPVPTLPTTCPDGSGLADFSVTLGSSEGGSTDPVAGNDTATFVNTIGKFADLGITMSAPASANIGDAFDVNVMVVNNGPCEAVKVEALDWDGLTDLGMTEADPTGDCSVDAGTWDADNAVCGFGTLQKGDTRTFSLHFTRGPFPTGLTQSGSPVTFDVYSGGRPYYSTSGHNKTSRTYDPWEADVVTDDVVSDNAGRTNTIVSRSVSGCSTGDMGGALSLLALGLPFLRRRRKS